MSDSPEDNTSIPRFGARSNAQELVPEASLWEQLDNAGGFSLLEIEQQCDAFESGVAEIAKPFSIVDL